jgi:hypothetical protein
LVLYPLKAPGTGEKIDILEGTEETEVTLPAGSYQAFIDLYDGTDKTSAVWTGVVHIYDGSDTALAQTFTPANFAKSQIVGVSENTLAGKLDAALDYPSGSYTIILDSTETTSTPKTFTVTGNKDITLIIEGKGNTVSLDKDGSNGSLLTLGADPGSSLTLVVQDLTLEGKSTNTASLVQVNSGGTLELKAGSVLTGNTAGYGGGVYAAKGGTLKMSGGTISGNSASTSGGGVVVYGDFTMSSGTISDNHSPVDGGGVLVWSGGMFTMSGGEVSGNSAAQGGGVYVIGGTFTMNGGVVNGNTSTTNVHSGGGVGLWTGGTFTMNGGEVSHNNALRGGGVGVNGGTFTMNGGVIYGSEESDDKANTANSGVAIYKKDNGSVNPSNLLTGATRDTTIDMRDLTP